ncbi:hypothetical protein B0G62_101285 [Paraburkholderia eburnea]|uniref:dTDP-glucose pyrophosphorylase n=1 Tax=Paraburkholderia eburnea TaxID=1189126 RepID=A0A2S4MMS3_9BURK|nr:glycosyltransferase family 2 protein [Paraburkholderia eburnea]POR55889.1 hypothetical protein B0G62_101285 [Paraburkholderia eburnea]PRZ27016.1 hypothetical protein BX588_101284 [Paraburkholderia eburnea]
MIIIPMVGLSSRFFKAGFTKPKFQLELSGETVFSRAVRSFEHYFDSERFLFITRPDYDTPAFVSSELERLGIANASVTTIAHDTQGQAETVSLGLKDTAGSEPLLIFNIDTFRYDYRKPDFIDTCDGYLEVFSGEGDHWSFVEPGAENSVLRTTEKERISSLCSDGLYYFKTRDLFETALSEARAKNETTKGEFYIAPLYNTLIKSGASIKYEEIALSEIDFCGTPDEFEALKKKFSS